MGPNDYTVKNGMGPVVQSGKTRWDQLTSLAKIASDKLSYIRKKAVYIEAGQGHSKAGFSVYVTLGHDSAIIKKLPYLYTCFGHFVKSLKTFSVVIYAHHLSASRGDNRRLLL